MMIKEVSKGEFAAKFGREQVCDGNFSYYLTPDSIGVRKDLRNNTVEIIGSDYEKMHEEQLERDILNSVCGDFKPYELGATNRPFWEWEEEAKPSIFLYYFPQIVILGFLLIIVVFCAFLIK